MSPTRTPVPTPTPTPAPDRPRTALDLFVASAALLALELALIRWLAAYVVFLTFFTNFVLLAAFLGTSAGCLAARRARFPGLGSVPWVLFGTVLAARVVAWVYERFGSVAISVGTDPRAQQMVYFGTEYRVPDPSRVAVPVEALAGAFFVLVALVFAGLGREIGRGFADLGARPLRAYAFNIAGSLAGIALLAVASRFSLPPGAWFGAALAAIAFLEVRAGTISRLRLFALALPMGIIAAPGAPREVEERWSPYYLVRHDVKKGEITVNRIVHQAMADRGVANLAYSLPHLLRRDAGGRPFGDVLVIGAGSGNDVAHALAHGVARVDAVEIDPLIAAIGKKHHPDRPYADPRVRLHVDDGRSFLRGAAHDRRYDLAVYALVDSLALHSAYASIRLESYLFTEEAFREVRGRLADDGVFALYNYYRAGWIVARIAALCERVFGRPPLVFSLPYEPEVRSEEGTHGRMTMILAGSDAALRPLEAAFAGAPGGLYRLPPDDLEGALRGNGFERAADAPGLAAVGPARLVRGVRGAQPPEDENERLEAPSDDWPFLYLRQRTIPRHNIVGAGIVVIVSIGLLWLAWPRRDAGSGQAGERGRSLRSAAHFFFLGAAFLLLETKGVVHAALLFGSTWTVNSAVFAAVLAMVLLANLYVTRVRPRRVAPYYALLGASLALSYVAGLDAFLGESAAAKLAGVALVLFLPIFFAGIVFATTFSRSVAPDVHIGANVAGAMLGGLAEYLSLVAGIRALLLIAAGLYALSWLVAPAISPLPTDEEQEGAKP